MLTAPRRGDGRRAAADALRARRGLLPEGVQGPADLARALGEVGYLADEGVATAAYLALALPRPLLLEGEAGVGKTSLAHALAEVLGADGAAPAVLRGHRRLAGAVRLGLPAPAAPPAGGRGGRGRADADRLEDEVYDRRFLLARPLLAALETTPSVLLVDEVDRADDEFEAFLLEVLSDYTVTVPELGHRARRGAAGRRRHVQPHPRGARRAQAALPLPLGRAPGLRPRGRDRAARGCRRPRPSSPRRWPAATQALRREDLLKPPGVAETIDWTLALVALGAERLDADTATATLGAVLKYREDQERAAKLDVGQMMRPALAVPEADRFDAVDSLVGLAAHAARRRACDASPDRVHAAVQAARRARPGRDGPTSTGPAG